MGKERDKITLTRPVCWQSDDGTHVVIEGPFPEGFVRSTDAGSVRQARGRDPNSRLGQLVARPATTSSGRYALTLAVYVVATENEWGEVGY